MNTMICAAGCDASTRSDEELDTARRLCLEAPAVILSDEQRRRGVRTAPNAVEEFHDLKEVSDSVFLASPGCYQKAGIYEIY